MKAIWKNFSFLYNNQTMTDKPFNNRWYDQQSRISVAVQLLKKFPAEIQTILCNGIGKLAEKDYEANTLMSHFKSLGTNAVLAIHKSHLKRRAYDKNPIIYKTMNYLFILTPKNRQFIAERILELMTLIQDYLTLCRETAQPVNSEDIEAITDTYVEETPEAARIILEQIEKEFMVLVQEKVNQLHNSLPEKKEDKKIEETESSQSPDYYS